MSDKKPVYNGYEERYLSGSELFATFENSYIATGRHHSEIIALPVADFLEDRGVNSSKQYRIFINQFFCRVMDADTDKLIAFFGHAALKDEMLNRRATMLLANRQCPKCNSPMISKDGKYGYFFSCSQYQNCRGSKNIPIITVKQ